MNSKNLYNDSEFKTIDRETSLIIPVNKIRNSTLYIRIPCNDICDYNFKYIMYKRENIIINPFREELQDFVYYMNDKSKNSLFTITTYSLNDYIEVSGDYNTNRLVFDKTYFNGYSSIVNPDKFVDDDDDDKPKDNKLRIKIESEGRPLINICHRTLEKNYINNNDNKYTEKDIVVGDKIYTSVENDKKQCFKIYKNTNENINNYIITFISKTKNILIDFYKSTNIPFDNLNLNEESDSIILESSLEKFCIYKNSNETNNNAMLAY